MYCLHCGDCCVRMSPISQPRPCPNIIKDGTYIFCGIYSRRPEQCENHEFDARFCPIGLSVLSLKTIDAVRSRIDEGYRRTGLL